MTTAVIGATGRVGSEIVRGALAGGAAVAIGSIEQVTRLSVLNASAGSLGINQRAHYENNYITGTFQQITGHLPRPVAEFLHTYRAEFA